MKKITAIAAATALCALCGGPQAAYAGVYADDMSRCLVEQTSKEDKAILVRWVFVALSQNPAVSSLSKATPADIETSNAAVGALFMRLLTEACLDKTKTAIKYEGPAAMQASFTVLGQAASLELFSDPKVRGVMEGLMKHLNKDKLEKLKDDGP
jgi:hypothetical protein